MRGTHQIDIVAFPCLEGKHYPGQLFPIHLIAFPHLADGVVLAEDASQITVGEENCSRAVYTYQGCLFPEVGAIAGNDDLVGNMAFPAFTSYTVGTATPGAQAALFKD